MIIYENTKIGFSDDVINGIIEDKIFDSIQQKMGRNTPESEIRSWMNSLEYMNGVLSDNDIPKNCGVAVEYNIPFTSKRVDFIISGLNEKKNNHAVVVELKQWEDAKKVDGVNYVVGTWVGGRVREVAHPSYQAWSYAKMIEDYNVNVQEIPIKMVPCAYLHNYKIADEDPLTDPCHREYIDLAPLFMRRDRMKLQEFIKKYIKYGDNKDTIFLMDSGRLRPSKSLQDSLTKMLDGNEEFIMIDEQKVVFERILKCARDSKRDGKKRVFIVKGGPGTGKSVLAVNSLVKLTAENFVVTYVTKNQAPRHVYSTKLKKSVKISSVDNLFRGAGGFHNAENDTFDVILADEAHRLNEKSGLYQNLGENQIKEIINSSRFTVFFIDEAQRVTLQDIGTISNITHYAKKAGAIIQETMELESQFRCDGSDGYVSWLNDVLQVEETANFDGTANFSYDIRVFKDPNELFNTIAEKNAVNNRSRIVAGYCWNWISKGGKGDVCDISIPQFRFGKRWNLDSTQTWAIDPESINEIGCIHTCQGLEFDYVGVIIGDDLRYENGEIVTDRAKRARTDMSLKGLNTKYPDPKEAARVADRIIKNTYRTLMTRGMKGCYIYCTDKNLEKYLEEKIERFNRN